MRSVWTLLLNVVGVAVFALAGVLVPGAARADVLRVGGTGAGTIGLVAMSDAVAAGAGVRIQGLPSLGSAGGMRALAGGRIDLAIIGRAVSAEEARSGARVAATVYTPFVFVTSRAAAPAMKLAEVVEAYGNSRAQWRDGSPVTLVLRQRSDGDAILLDRLFQGMAAAVERARKRSEVLVSVVDDDNADMAEQTGNSLATMSYSQVRIERRKLQVIAVNDVAPSVASVRDGSYPYARPFHLVLPAKPGAAALRFVAFLQSERGKDALRDVHWMMDYAP